MNRILSIFTSFLLSILVASAAVTITTTSKTFTKDGGAASVSTGGSGTWTATTTASWITLNRASGDAGVSCVYVVSANYSADTRTATIDIGGNTYTVTQTGYTATISPTSASKTNPGGSGTITITVDAGVSWTAKANASWLSVTPTSGMSAGSVTYTVAAYTGGTTTRTGSLTVAGQTFTVTQTGTDVTISPTSKTLDAPANVFEVTVSALSSTSWAIRPNASWISVVDSGYGYGNSTILVAVGQNPSVNTRTGTVSIGSKTLTITQTGMTDPVLSITPTTATASPTGAYGNIAVYATPDATWTSESLSDWITISEGDTGAGNGNIKYVATANPTLSTRTGRIRVIPPAYDPENEMDVGRVMAFENQSTKADRATGTRTLSKAPTTMFDGTFSNDLSGDPLPKQDDNAFSFGFQFKIGEMNTINRLVRLFGSHALYINADNMLCYDSTVSSFAIAKTNQDYRVVFTQDRTGTIKLYAAELNKIATQCASFSASSLRNFTTGTTPVEDAFQLGYTTKPSTGYLRNGTVSSLVFWQRTLSPGEAGRFGSWYSFKQDSSRSVLDTAPLGAPSSILATHFRCSGNGNYTVTGGNDVNLHPVEDGGVTVSGWSAFSGRTGLKQRAMTSDGAGRIAIPNMNKIFSEGTGSYSSYGTDGQGPYSATYNFWVYLDKLPSGSAQFFMSGWTKTVSGTNGDSSSYMWNQPEPFGLEVNSQGAVVLQNNTEKTTYSVAKLEPRRWHMVTLVGTHNKNISMYLDGKEIGNVNSTLTFAYVPRYPPPSLYTLADQYNSYARNLSVGGWDGAIDEFTIYHAALTAAQVKALYDACPPTAVYHTVTQGVISPVVSPTSVSFDAAGGSTNAQVTVAASTQWTAHSNASWITITSTAPSAGSARVSFDVAPNPSTEARTGTLTLAGKTVTVTQSGLWSQLTYDGTVFNETSDSGWIDVQVEGDGTWTASTDASWLTLLDTQGHGSASVMFVVDDFNTTVASRTATVTIAGKQVQVTQRGYELSIDPAVAEIGSNAGAGEIGITAPIDAVWEALVTADWISLVGGTTGVGSGTLRYTVADNTTGQTRTGKIVISGQEYTVTQHPYLTLTTVSDGQGSVAGGGNFETNERATLTATPATGYVFSHWSGDAVGVDPTVSFTMDTSKTVTAHFIPEGAAQRLAEEKAAQGGFYTRDQMRQLALGDTVIEMDGNDGNIGLTIQLQERPDLGSGSWQDVDMHGKPVSVDAEGRVHLRVPPKGNSAFYRLVNKGEEE